MGGAARFDESGAAGENNYVAASCGPVAQLGARFHGMEEVIGSIPIRSTNYLNDLARLFLSFQFSSGTT
jgi:hypothetical protein